MYLIEFTNEEGKRFLLHDGKYFQGGTKEDAEKICQAKIISDISANFHIVWLEGSEALAETIGILPQGQYKILDFTNGLTRWMGVERIK